jgi:hypothetical protein
LGLTFGSLETVDHPDAGTGLVVGLQGEMQVALEDQTPAVLTGLEESAREIGILTLPHLWRTVVVLVNYMQTKPIHGH